MFHTEYKIPACPACAGRAGRQNTRYGGFTLVEVLVAMTIFVGTLVIMSQIYVSAMRSERVAYALLQNDESARYALDYMSKTIRMGKDFKIPDDAITSIDDDETKHGTELSFNYYYVDPTGNNTGWQPISYTFKSGSIYRTFLNKEIVLFPPTVSISNGSWTLTPKTDEEQVEVKIRFTVQSPQQPRGFEIETAVTPRLIFSISNSVTP